MEFVKGSSQIRKSAPAIMVAMLVAIVFPNHHNDDKHTRKHSVRTYNRLIHGPVCLPPGFCEGLLPAQLAVLCSRFSLG